MQSLGDEYDAILIPSACGEAPESLTTTGNPIFCIIWTYLDVLAVNLPLMEGENGMPLGVQLAGPKGDDVRLLRSARWLAGKVASES